MGCVPTIKNTTICLVEDHNRLREQLTSLLQSQGYEVVAASATVAEGLRTILLLKPDIAVIDHRLPDGSGIELCRALKISAPEVVLLLHTGTVTVEIERNAYEAGADEVIAKDIRGESLLKAILRHLHDNAE